MTDPLDSPVIPPPLREALRFSPDNVPLTLHVADTALKNGGGGEAEALFRRALARDPQNHAAKLGLAHAFFHQGKYGEAIVLAEVLCRGSEPAPRALLLHARLALRAGEPKLASREYQRARAADATIADAAFEQELANYLPRPVGPGPGPAPAPATAAPAARETPPPPPAPPSTSTFSDPFLADPAAAASESDDAIPGANDETDEPVQVPLSHGEIHPAPAEPELEQPKLSFADVGGMERVKEEVRMKILLPLQQPELFKAYGKKIGGGILMYGPPGCGKTFLARATAGEVKANFLAVGISDVLDMWLGQSERNLHALFEHARAHKPCVLFFDEVDALGANRSDMVRSSGRHLINQFLAELDGVQASNEGVLILAATNAPWHLDPAFRRPGRFDRIVFVPPPDTAARAAILRLQLKGKPCETVDFDAIAKRTDGFSGADLKAVVDLAVEEKLRESMRRGTVQAIGGADLLEAVKRHRPSVRDWFETARNYALYANQSGLYDDVLAHLNLKR